MWKFSTAIINKLKLSLSAALPLLIFVVFILLNIAIWWAGPWLNINGYNPLETTTARILTMSLFILGSLSIWGILQWRKLLSYQQNQEYQEKLKHDPIRLYEQQQEVELNRVMLNMKRSINRKNYLYQMPWYLVIGLDKAGKTSLINRSGQNFTLSSVMKVSGFRSSNPHSFDWLISDEAVLIDPDGALLTQRYGSNEDDGVLERRLWLHFIDWLKKTREHRPLNGLVLAVDLSHLATATESEKKVYSSLIRTRLHELTEAFSSRLPIYITFTKLDLLYGFEAFFKTFKKDQREDAFGFTFSLHSIENSDQWLDEFDNQYTHFVKTINEQLLYAVKDPITQEERAEVYSFVRQMSGLKTTIYQFLVETFSHDQFSIPILVRGAYFTSVHQQGVPINAFDMAASHRYGLDHSVNAAQKITHSSSYFVRKLFSHIIYPEAGLGSDNSKVAKRYKLVSGLSIASCSIASVLLIGTWHNYYLRNIKHSDGVLTKVNQYNEQASLEIDIYTQKDMLASLNKIREATLEFGIFREKQPIISEFGLYQGHTIGPMVETTYLNLLEYRFLPKLMADIAVDLQKTQSDDAKLDVLRVYQMMVDRSGRHTSYIKDYFSKKWQKEFSGQKEIQGQLLNHLDYAMLHTDLAGDRKAGNSSADKVMKPFDGLVSRVQSDLGSVPNELRIYRNLKLQAQTVLGPSINLRNLIGPVFDMVYTEQALNSTHLYIPQILTKRGFEDYFVPQSEAVSELALIDSWVLGQSKLASFSDADKQDLREKIRHLYIADYINTWQSALNEINIKYFNDITDAVAVLDSIIGNMEPVQRLLRTINDNTRLIDSFSHSEELKAAVIKTPKYQVASSIESPFFELNNLIQPIGNNPSYLNEVLISVEALRNTLKLIQDAPDVGFAALSATKARVNLLDSDPIYALKRIANGLPEPLNRLFNKIAEESWYVVKHEAIKHLEIRWYKDVYSEFQDKLAGRYPFNQQAKKDVSLQDFEAFFSPSGKLNRFYHEQLKVFIEENVNVDVNDTPSSLIRADIIEAFDQADKIRSAFFNRKGILDVNFSVEPLRLSSNKRRSVLNVDGQYLTYSHGARNSVEFIWPNTLRDSAVSKVTLVPIKPNLSPRSVNIQGPWAFFRLLERSEVMSAGVTSVDYKFSVDDGEMMYRIHAGSETNPFTERLFKSFKLSQTLY